MRTLELAGCPAEMGETFGRTCRREIGELYARRVANALAQARRYGARAGEEDLLALADACLPPWRAWHPAGVEELLGIARGADRSPAEMAALGGLTDLRDALAWGGRAGRGWTRAADAPAAAGPPGPEAAAGDEGCTAAVVAGDASADGCRWLAQTWDLATDNAPFVVAVHRRPAPRDGAGEPPPETWCVTTVGCLSLMGINAHGLAVGTTNLRTRDARPGVPYLGVLHRALETSAPEAAEAVVREAPRAGGHVFLLVGAGDARVVEATATRSATIGVAHGVHVHTNHCLLPAHAALEADTPRASSDARHRRMRTLLAEVEGAIDAASLRRCLADEAGGPLAICRDDADGISTNAAMVVGPGTGRMEGCAGRPSQAPWVPLGPGW